MAERWVLSVRRELLDHAVVFNEDHLHRLLSEYIRYYHEDRCHLALEKDTPHGRPVTPRPSPSASVVSLPRVAGFTTDMSGGTQLDAGKRPTNKDDPVSLIMRRAASSR